MNCANRFPAAEHLSDGHSSSHHPASARPPTRQSTGEPRTNAHPAVQDSCWLLSHESQTDFGKIKHTSAFPTDTIIFIEGQSAGGVFVLKEGRVKLSTCSSEGKTMILRIAESGDIVGLHASITGVAHAMTVSTMQPCTVDFVGRDRFLQFLREHSDAALRVTEILSQECIQAYELARTMGLSTSVSERFARFLLETALRGQMKNGRAQGKLTLTHEEISQVVGTSRETITRLLSEFKRKDMVELNGTTLTICNRTAMESLSGRVN